MSRLSLRLRLVAGVVALAAVALVAVGGVTYAQQRDFLRGRVDDQARAAAPVVGRALDVQGVPDPGSPRGGRPGGPGGAFDPRGPGLGPPPRGGDPRDKRSGPLSHPGPGPGPRGRGGPPLSLPPGVYGERRDRDGSTLGSVVVTYGQRAPSPPDLPTELEPGEIVTAGARDGSGLEYRVSATPTPGGESTTVVAVPLSGVDEQLDELLVVEALVIGGVLALMGGLGFWLVRAGLRPLDRIEATAGRIAAGDLSQRVPATDPRTEVGRLGGALNTMLGQIERAFAQREESEGRLRRFLADASHELRTPLASIRGYAELYRMGATADEAERARAIARIEQEAERMGVLVEDLLTLARLDEVRGAVRELVDLAELARDAAADARASAPDREIELAVAGEDTAVRGDAHQLRQVLANLVRNALVHTPAGTPVQVRADRDGDHVRVAVRDHGPGLPAGGPELFERFWRAEAARGRGPAGAGAGLGLAIVHGIVTAHGGTVIAADAEGGGARFEVRLPGLDAASLPSDAAPEGCESG